MVRPIPLTYVDRNLLLTIPKTLNQPRPTLGLIPRLGVNINGRLFIALRIEV